MTIEWEQVGPRQLIASLPVDNGRCAFVEKGGGDGYIQYGVKYLAIDDGSLGSISGVYSVTRSLACRSEKEAKENAEKMLKMVFVDHPDQNATDSVVSHFQKALDDPFDYAVLLSMGGQLFWVRVRSLEDHPDGWVTLQGVSNVGNHHSIFNPFPMPRGVSVRRECILCVMDAPEGS